MNPGMIPVRAEVLDHSLKFVEIASAFTKRAMDELAVHHQAQKKAADLRKSTLDHMLSSDVVKEHQKEAADAMLGSHDTTLVLLKTAVDKIVLLKAELKKRAGDTGVAEGDASGSEKTAGDYNSLTDSRVGHRTSFVKESDKPLLAIIGQ